MIHILFTTQYHFPLSKFNYLLQLSGILLVLGSIIGSIVVVMAAQERSSTHWPYMLDYISVNTPPSTWSKPQKGAWFFLQSLCNGMVHVSLRCTVRRQLRLMIMLISVVIQLTHIQFLTLLFPSATEVKLIFLLLGQYSDRMPYVRWDRPLIETPHRTPGPCCLWLDILVTVRQTDHYRSGRRHQERL